MISNDLENAAMDYSNALFRFNYSISYGNGQSHDPERFQEGADEQAIDNLLNAKEQRFLALLRKETDANQLKQIAYKNMNDIEDRKVLIPMLERYVELCGPNILVYLLLSVLYWTHGEDEVAERYLDMAAEIDSDNLYVLRHRLLNTNDPQDQARICNNILERYPDDPAATETLRRIRQGIEPFLSPRTGEHTSIDFVLSKLICNTLE